MDAIFWQSIVDSDYAVPDGHSAESLSPELIAALGSTDPTVREEYGYGILAQWVALKPKYASDGLCKLRDLLVESLSKGIGEQSTDTVFLRAFAMLALAAVAYRDIDEPFLEKSEVEALLDATVDYLEQEKDLRGYVPGKGWAHALAHTADVLKFLARNPSMEIEGLRRIVDSIAHKLTAGVAQVFVHYEDERLAFVVLEVLKRDKLDRATFQSWLDQFQAWKETNFANIFVGHELNEELHATFQNIRNFLRSLHICLEKTDPETLPETAIAFKTDLFEITKQFNLR